ncbi:MAG: Holliday junction resolvase RuvX [Paludibacteraceae bacterium]|nr:Holliday junction resolvase RuvX [Paludibacteraceae bacterium]MBP5136998.1 Holliday junction resolvase RuvX [Paludibacteraceae bacterium]MBP5742712.1 Holliday junction resolvase RuvX [Paludibacteraceae bacterium]
MGRLLALDVGKARVGVAVTDPMQIIPNGLTTVENKKLADFLKDYLKKESVDEFIVGLPKQMDGTDSQSMPYVQQVVAMLKRNFPNVPVKMQDERFTSKIAHQAMIDGGMKKMQRRDKAIVDQISATIILQSYMDNRF